MHCSYGFDPFGLSKKPQDFDRYNRLICIPAILSTFCTHPSIKRFLGQLLMPIHSAGTKRTSLSTPGGLCWALPDSCSLKHSTSSAPSAAQRLSGGRYVQHLNPLYHRYGRHFVVYRCLSLNMTSSYGVWRKSFL